MKNHDIDLIGKELIKKHFPTSIFVNTELEEIYQIFGFEHFSEGIKFLTEHGIGVERLKYFISNMESIHDLPDDWNTGPKRAGYFEVLYKLYEETFN